MNRSLNTAEQMALSLGTLFEGNGYLPYKMSKFEEYDLYARNKDFLISDSVITFTDMGGKLMALKPDVTLSIVKNSKDRPWVQKVYYKENVYRVSKNTHGYKEIMQLGLEAMGDIDDYTVLEVLTLAEKSLAKISSNAVLEVSHLGIIKELTDAIGIPLDRREQLVKLISEKNPHELTALCRNCGIADEDIDLLRWITTASGSAETMLPALQEKLAGKVCQATLVRFETVLSALDGNVIVDFSVVDNIHYYNGFVFRGFVSGIPDPVLSGGQYDKLMKKMNRTAGAIGFAVYADQLQRLEQESDAYDVDVLLLYQQDTPLAQLQQAVRNFAAQGLSVSVQKATPETLRYKTLAKFNGSEVQIIENDA
jgi:ATP phosphoribosyltransferase regulatory subunit